MPQRVLKGHGTGNDFVLVPDPDAATPLTAADVVALCDRHAGVGADGVLRVVPTAREPEVADQSDVAPWFMDYRNADGSVAEMCGNGVRVFARYLVAAGLADGTPGAPLVVATRGGAKAVGFHADGRIGVDMGPATPRPERPTVRVARLDGGTVELVGTAWELPNPHVVCELDADAELDALDLARPPAVDPALPRGQNVEFVRREGERTLRMRVHERGSGETRSCGTGICAVVAALAGPRPEGEWTVHVPGGTCTVTGTPAGTLVLTGPAVLVAEVELRPGWRG